MDKGRVLLGILSTICYMLLFWQYELQLIKSGQLQGTGRLLGQPLWSQLTSSQTQVRKSLLFVLIYAELIDMYDANMAHIVVYLPTKFG